MNLSDVIKTIKPIEETIQKIKDQINKNEIDLIKQIDKIILNDKVISMELINSKCIDSINNSNILIQNSIQMFNNYKKIQEKISNLYINYNTLNNNKHFNKEWVGGKTHGTIVETDDGYRIRFDEQSRSFKYKNYIISEKMIICENKEDCYKKATKFLYDY